MATLKETVYKILQDDAKTESAGLGLLLGKHENSPYGIYFMNPSAELEPPFVTYFFNASSGIKPREFYLNVTAWGNAYESILKRIEALLDNANLSSADDYTAMACTWDWESSELYDENFHCYYRQVRYLIRVWK